jgi:hypothetical protein
VGRADRAALANGSTMLRLPSRRTPAGSIAAIALAWLSGGAAAQIARLDPPDPVDTTALSVSYAGVRANTGIDETLADPSIRARNQVGTLALRRTFALGGQTSAVGVSVPYAMVLGYDRATNVVLRDSAGVGDVSLSFEAGLFGLPALATEAFGARPASSNGALRLTVTAPTGEHEPGLAPDVGGNRWVGELRYRHVHVRADGRTWVELIPGVRLFGADDDPAGGGRLTQRPQFFLQGHWSTEVGPSRTWVGAGLAATAGGRVDLDGAPRGEAAHALRAVLSAGVPLWTGGGASVGYSRTLVHSGEAPRVDRIEFLLRHRF